MRTNISLGNDFSKSTIWILSHKPKQATSDTTDVMELAESLYTWVRQMEFVTSEDLLEITKIMQNIVEEMSTFPEVNSL